MAFSKNRQKLVLICTLIPLLLLTNIKIWSNLIFSKYEIFYHFAGRSRATSFQFIIRWFFLKQNAFFLAYNVTYAYVLQHLAICLAH